MEMYDYELPEPYQSSLAFDFPTANASRIEITIVLINKSLKHHLSLKL